MADKTADESAPVSRSSTKPAGTDRARQSLSEWISSAKKMVKRTKLLSGLRIRKKHRKSGSLADELRASPSLDIAAQGRMARLPDLVGKSDLLSEAHQAALYKELPPRVEGHPWTLVFSTAEDGFSLKSLYRKSQPFQSPMLFVVQDSESQLFGALTSDPLRMGPHFYGTGESFLFRMQPEFRTFGWTGENSFFARGSPVGLEFGSGEGHPGLFLDEDLYHGHTQRCPTFDNEPLTDSREFLVHAIEVWALG